MSIISFQIEGDIHDECTKTHVHNVIFIIINLCIRI